MLNIASAMTHQNILGDRPTYSEKEKQAVHRREEGTSYPIFDTLL